MNSYKFFKSICTSTAWLCNTMVLQFVTSVKQNNTLHYTEKVKNFVLFKAPLILAAENVKSMISFVPVAKYCICICCWNRNNPHYVQLLSGCQIFDDKSRFPPKLGKHDISGVVSMKPLLCYRFHRQQNKCYPQRCFLAPFEATLDFTRSEFTCP